ncbi:replication protein [Lactiplantibacillus paraplantarum]|nr:replication protein [Lactiplantibacillus paraplantarum]
MKNSSQLKQIIAEAVSRQPKGRFLFLTLTVKNACGAEELRSSLRVLTKAFNKLTRYKKVTKNLLGYLRSTEITVNDEDRSYNQHLHVLLFVKSSYFTGNNTNYIKQAEWTKLWQRALKVDYEPVVHVEIVKANKRKGTGSLQASAEETAKYEVKSSDYMTADDDRNLEVINDLEYALAGTRQISYGGLFKQIKQDLKLEDVDKGDLVHVGNEEYSKEQMEAAEEVVAKWDFKKQNYFMW